MTLWKKAAVLSVGGVVGVFYFSPDLRRKLSGFAGDLSAGRCTRISSPPTALPRLRDGTMTLKNVQILFRHGARTPLKHIPGLEEVTYDHRVLLASVPHTEVPYTVEYLLGGPRPKSSLQKHYSETSFKGGVVAGTLTTVGKNQAYLLGQRIAGKYRDRLQLIGTQFTDDELYLRSTNIDRCIVSLQCCIAGMFGVTSFVGSNPIVIRVENIEQEIIFPNPRNCTTFKQMLKQSRAVYETSPEYINLIRRVQAHTGDNSSVADFDMMQLRDHIVARQAHGLSVPKFLMDLSPEVDRAAVEVLLHYVCGYVRELRLADDMQAAVGTGARDVPQLFRDCTQQARIVGLALSMGRTWHLIAKNIQAAAGCGKSEITTPADARPLPKLLLYCCHDSSLAPLLLALGCFDNEWPPYCAEIAFELYEDTRGQHWVNVAYCGKDMVLAGCDEPMIPLERFLDIVKPYAISPDQHTTYCSDLHIASELIGANIIEEQQLKETPLPNVV